MSKSYYDKLGISINGVYSFKKASAIIGVSKSSIHGWSNKIDSIYHFTPGIKKVSSTRIEYTITGRQILDIYIKKNGVPPL